MTSRLALVSTVKQGLVKLESTEEFRNGSGDIVLLAKDAMKEVLEEARKPWMMTKIPLEIRAHASLSCFTLRNLNIITAFRATAGQYCSRQSSELFELTPDHSWSNPKRKSELSYEVRTKIAKRRMLDREDFLYGTVPSYELYTKDAQPGLAMSRVRFTSVKTAGIISDPVVRRVKHNTEGKGNHSDRRHSGALSQRSSHESSR